MISRSALKTIGCLVLLPALAIEACHREERAVVRVEKDAVEAEHRAHEQAIERDQERAELDQIPLPTKSLYVDIHDPSQWANPFLAVGAETVTLRVIMADANPSPVGQGTLLRPAAARRQQLELRIADVDTAVAAIPPAAWPYGRVIAVEETTSATSNDRPKVRRNLEAMIRQLNDLGVVVEEWPSR